MPEPEVFASVEEAERIIKGGYLLPLLNPHRYVERSPEDIAKTFQVCLDTIRALFAERDAKNKHSGLLQAGEALREEYKLQFALQQSEIVALTSERDAERSVRVLLAQGMDRAAAQSEADKAEAADQLAKCDARIAELEALQEAQEALHSRTKIRMERGVEGTSAL